MKNLLLTAASLLAFSLCMAQSNYYDVTSGNGYGVRFWSANNYKIAMGNTSEYRYGPVTDYSIKTNMDNYATNGWTWGVLSTTPIAALNTEGHLQIAGAFYSGQHLGVGTNSISNYGSWTRVLEVSGSTDSKLIATSNSKTIRIGMFSNGTWTSGGGGYLGTETNHNLIFVTNYTPSAVLTTAGNMGIGTLTPDSKLSVKGQIHAQEVKIDLLGAIAPDYVFAKDYKLPSLETIRSYIDQYHHLPEVPSAKEMEENGINVKDMNLLLLKKIEELTLYIIRQEDRINALEAKVNSK